MTASLVLTFTVKIVFCPKTIWKKSQRNNLIPFTKYLHRKELQNNVRVQPDLDSQTFARVTNLIINYWGCFFKEGAQWPILEYGFNIDTGTAKPVCCRKPQYVPYESKTIMSQIEGLLQNEWIYACGWPWDRSIVLAENPRQEQVTNFENFIWNMWVSYRKLSDIIKYL